MGPSGGSMGWGGCLEVDGTFFLETMSVYYTSSSETGKENQKGHIHVQVRVENKSMVGEGGGGGGARRKGARGKEECECLSVDMSEHAPPIF